MKKRRKPIYRPTAADMHGAACRYLMRKHPQLTMELAQAVLARPLDSGEPMTLPSSKGRILALPARRMA